MTRPFTSLTLIGLILTLTVITACAGQQSRIDPDMRSIHVEPFRNHSDEPGLENDLTEETIRQFLADGRLDVAEQGEADAILRGTITAYKRIPLVYDERDRVEQYRLRIEMNLEMIDPETNEQMWRTDRIFRQTNYSQINPPFETEQDAQDRLFRQLALDAVTTSIDGWPYLRN